MAAIKAKDLSNTASDKQRDLSVLAAQSAREASATELLNQKTQYEQEAMDTFETTELSTIEAKNLSDTASDIQRDLLLNQKTQYEQEAMDAA